MERKSFPRSLSILLELIAAIVIFAVAAAICTRVLVSARNLSLEAEHLNRAVESVTSAAELLRGVPEEEALERLSAFPELRVTRREEQGLVYYSIEYLSEGAAVYALEVAREGGAR